MSEADGKAFVRVDGSQTAFLVVVEVGELVGDGQALPGKRHLRVGDDGRPVRGSAERGLDAVQGGEVKAGPGVFGQAVYGNCEAAFRLPVFCWARRCQVRGLCQGFTDNVPSSA